MISNVNHETELAPRAATASRRRVFVLATHVVQYASPLFRALANDPRLDFTVLYCSMQGAESGKDPEFGIDIRWDEPLLDDYYWLHVPNRSLRPGLGRFFGLFNPGLWRTIRSAKPEAVVLGTGYMYASFWLAVFAAWSCNSAVVFSSDTSTLAARDGARWKTWIKPFLLGKVYKMSDAVMVTSEAGKKIALQLGVPEKQVRIIRSGMSKESWLARLQTFDRESVRRELNIPPSAPVVFFCAKFQQWKSPLDLLNAFARAAVKDAYLVFAGDGPQKQEILVKAQSLGIADRIRMLGFVNLSRLPGFYKAADLFVLPSKYDPCPFVVLEAMFSGLPVVLSDAVEGRLDLIHEGRSGYIYPCGDVDRLANILRRVLQDPAHLAQLQEGARHQMESWKIDDFLDSWTEAVEIALAPRHKT
jgi:glycosyltransferase involved in cell wall biosynthesis